MQVMWAAQDVPTHAQHALMQWKMPRKCGGAEEQGLGINDEGPPVHRMPRPLAPGPASAVLDLSQARAPRSQGKAPWSTAWLIFGHGKLANADILGYMLQKVGITPVKDRRAWKVPAQAQQSGAPEQIHAIAWQSTAAVSSHPLPVSG